MLSQSQLITKTDTTITTQLRVNVWNKHNDHCKAKTIEPKKTHCVIPFCIGYKEETYTVAQLQALIEGINKKGYSYTLFLSDREKQDNEIRSPLDIFKEEYHEVLKNIPAENIKTKAEWRQTEIWKEAEQNYQRYISDTKNKEKIDRMVKEDVDKYLKTHPECSREYSTQHVIGEAITCLSWMISLTEEPVSNIMFYSHSITAIMRHFIQQCPDKFGYTKDSLLVTKPQFTEVVISNNKTAKAIANQPNIPSIQTPPKDIPVPNKPYKPSTFISSDEKTDTIFSTTSSTSASATPPSTPNSTTPPEFTSALPERRNEFFTSIAKVVYCEEKDNPEKFTSTMALLFLKLEEATYKQAEKEQNKQPRQPSPSETQRHSSSSSKSGSSSPIQTKTHRSNSAEESTREEKEKQKEKPLPRLSDTQKTEEKNIKIPNIPPSLSQQTAISSPSSNSANLFYHRAVKRRQSDSALLGSNTSMSKKKFG